MAETNTLLLRYPPNSRYNSDAFKKSCNTFVTKVEVFGDSVTDKESYRLSLASKRGSISSIGSAQSGYYMFPDGKYEGTKDFSYLLRKDLSIVEIDEYINEMKSNLEKADSDLKSQIEEQISKANEMKSDLMSKNTENKSNQDVES